MKNKLIAMLLALTLLLCTSCGESKIVEASELSDIVTSESESETETASDSETESESASESETVSETETDSETSSTTETAEEPTSDEVENETHSGSTETVEAGHQHNYTVIENVPATCEAGGKCVSQCECGDVKTVTTKKLEHKFKTSKKTAATCTEAGSETKTCELCGKEETEAVGALGHDYSVTKTNATCTQAGDTTYKCTRCGDTKSESGKALGHDFKATKTTNATCTKEGKIEYKCSRCSETKSETTPATNHNYVTTTKAATCTTNGSSVTKCSICGNVQSSNTIQATNHKWGNTKVNGKTSSHSCTVCGATESWETPSANHTHSWTKTSSVTATCSSAGYDYYACTCGETKSEKTSGPVAHKKGNYKRRETANCEKPEMTYYGCVYNCDYEFAEQTAPALGHDWRIASRTNPKSCLEDETIDYVCRNNSQHTKTEVEPGQKSHTYTTYLERNKKNGGGRIFHTACCAAADSYRTIEDWSSSDFAKVMVEKVNAKRAECRQECIDAELEEGCPLWPYNVSLDSTCQQIAEMRAKQIVERYEHDGGPYGEVLAAGLYDNEVDAWNAWMKSNNHTSIIVSSQYTKMGAAYASDGNGVMYFVMIFM